jgi:hypothetical protein
MNKKKAQKKTKVWMTVRNNLVELQIKLTGSRALRKQWVSM